MVADLVVNILKHDLARTRAVIDLVSPPPRDNDVAAMMARLPHALVLLNVFAGGDAVTGIASTIAISAIRATAGTGARALSVTDLHAGSAVHWWDDPVRVRSLCGDLTQLIADAGAAGRTVTITLVGGIRRPTGDGSSGNQKTRPPSAQLCRRLLAAQRLSAAAPAHGHLPYLAICGVGGIVRECCASARVDALAPDWLFNACPLRAKLPPMSVVDGVRCAWCGQPKCDDTDMASPFHDVVARWASLFSGWRRSASTTGGVHPSYVDDVFARAVRRDLSYSAYAAWCGGGETDDINRLTAYMDGVDVAEGREIEYASWVD